MITLEDWALIRRLAADGVPKARIAAQLGISRTTVVKAVASGSPPRYERAPAVTSFSGFEGRVRALLQDVPSMPATVIAERVGWPGSITWFRQNVARLRPEYRPIDPADRLLYDAGDQAQCDLWFPPAEVPTQGRTAPLPVLVIVASHSRFITARMLPSRTTPDLVAGMWSLISEQLRAVPRRLIWDNEAGIGRRNKLADGVTGFTGALATRIVQLKPFDPESKGIVERANGYLETSFLPGRRFASPDDFNQQLTEWLPRANTRKVRSLNARPIDLISNDRARMLPLPPVIPTLGHQNRVRLGRDYYVSIAGNDYSVDPTASGRMIDVRADLSHVTVRQGGRLVASHDREWGSGIIVTAPEHVQTAARLRAEFQQPRPAGVEELELARDLADYDRAFGIEVA
ncbi:IS21 family transposase [Subtercola sp. YIM 133946]|uniref:IS21 family transposase n=1 Tax=Subtercola sp. YIM 133946 TaxID=3118909 RepID=UPI002F94232F